MILPSHFRPAPSRDAAKQLFATSVRKVEIEIFSYCNRTCWFCPNSTIDRRSTNHYMDEELYLRILSELTEIGYSEVLTYSRYNEPLADRLILKRLRQARQLLPGALLSTHTNGDYLTRAYLNELREAGLNRIFIMVYLGNNEQFSDEKILARLTSKAQELDLPCEFTITRPGIHHSARLCYDGMDVRIEARNYAALGTDRGKLIQLAPYVRTSWCPVVFEALYIDWNGCVVPCCNIRSDAPAHSEYIVDDLSQGRSIFDIWAGSRLAGWRRSLANFDQKIAPCDSCSYDLMPESPELRVFFNAVNRAFVANYEEGK